MTSLGCTRQCRSNIFRTSPNSFLWYLINGLECTVQNILLSLNTLLAKPAPKKEKLSLH